MLIDQEIKWRLGHQLIEFDGVDSKATTVLGATGVVFGLVANAAVTFDHAPVPARVMLYLALLVLLGGLAVGVRNLWPRLHAVVPEPSVFLKTYRTKSGLDTLQELSATRCLAFENNKPVLSSKVGLLRNQMILLVVAGLSVTLAYLGRAIL
jgi:hypothetical protein